MTLAFFDTNVIVYAFTDDPKALITRELLQMGGVISVQSLNELSNVMLRKQRRSWIDIHAAIGFVRDQCGAIVSLDDALHRDGLRVAERYRLSIYDGMIVSAALAARCDTLYSEDMHDGLVFDGRLRIVNPFRPVST